MGKLPHPFRPYFELISNPNNKSNKFAVCLCCIEEYTRNIAITKKECRVINKVKSCYDQLAKCENFKKRYSESEYTEILTLNSNDGNKVIAGKRKEIEGVPCENEVNEDNKRVKNKKVLEMARIRSDILYKRKIKEVEGGQKQARRLHIAPPILNNQEEEENEPVYEDDDEDLNVSDLEDDSSEEDNDSDEEEETRDDFHWSEICTNWINLVDRENQFDNEEDNHLLEMTYDFFAAGRDQHPADDETAKWKLEYLFKENLKAPTFLGIEYTSSLNDSEM
ncbi:6094_t:CDS:2 [Rhizophagus irregularis]|nr:6094_t:CDS:2 [Rhizophagus irregularis]